MAPSTIGAFGHSARCPSSISVPRSRRKVSAENRYGRMAGGLLSFEPQAGSDAQNSRTRAVLFLTGAIGSRTARKCGITNGGFADVPHRFRESRRREVFRLLSWSVGSRIFRRRRRKENGAASQFHHLIFFENCKVPREKPATRNPLRISSLSTFSISGRFTLGASCLGFCKSELESAARYSKERTAFGHSAISTRASSQARRDRHSHARAGNRHSSHRRDYRSGLQRWRFRGNKPGNLDEGA